MKTLTWFRFFAPPRPEQSQGPGRLARMIDVLSRGSIPVDGCDVPDREAAREQRAEPVRWGNFR